MYFWFYQPRAQEAFRHKVRSMAEADRAVLLSAQLVLMREREVSQFLVDGLLGRNFSKPLAFFLDRRKGIPAPHGAHLHPFKTPRSPGLPGSFRGGQKKLNLFYKILLPWRGWSRMLIPVHP